MVKNLLKYLIYCQVVTAKYTELRDGDVIVRVGQRHVRGMDSDNVVSIINGNKA